MRVSLKDSCFLEAVEVGVVCFLVGVLDVDFFLFADMIKIMGILQYFISFI